MRTAAEQRAADREREWQIAELAGAIREALPEIGPKAATRLARKRAAEIEAAKPDGIGALLAEFAALGVRG